MLVEVATEKVVVVGEVDEEAEDAGLEWSGGILRSHVDSHNVLISAGSALL